MLTFTLVAILGVLLVIVLMKLFKKEPKPLPAPVKPVEDLANLKVTDARSGDVLSVAGAGDNMSDLDYTEVVSGLQEGEQVLLLSALSMQARRDSATQRMRSMSGGGMPGAPAATPGRGRGQ